ncbi:hypothetical protein R6Q59_004264 [Mikania micrantha]
MACCSLVGGLIVWPYGLWNGLNLVHFGAGIQEVSLHSRGLSGAWLMIGCACYGLLVKGCWTVTGGINIGWRQNMGCVQKSVLVGQVALLDCCAVTVTMIGGCLFMMDSVRTQARCCIGPWMALVLHGLGVPRVVQCGHGNPDIDRLEVLFLSWPIDACCMGQGAVLA